MSKYVLFMKKTYKNDSLDVMIRPGTAYLVQCPVAREIISLAGLL